ncbi:PRTRC system protein C [Chitinophaga rhizophila]|uniref:PRTRC system protein C n=1 Tax=Chitinophaga rhizophila TaxID=2866212 RepID=A0ABS7G9N2_9BACT|nr:PRTRC system protein C [Chitinophaga rhizophila]MBW8683504.1 PRTRC system protein C [Chitinophaga rhizophila]
MQLATVLEREFTVTVNGKPVTLKDPDNSWTPKQVRSFYGAATYPQVLNANIEGPVIENDKRVYKFVTTLGTKG